jgi:hypothetical protein
MHFNVAHSTVKDIFLTRTWIAKILLKMRTRSAIRGSEKASLDTSVELFALLGPYSELQFGGIATDDESWVCYTMESDSMLACRPEEIIPKLRQRISINNVMTTVFFTARHSLR